MARPSEQPLAVTLPELDWHIICGWLESLQQTQNGPHGIYIPTSAEKLAKVLRKEHFTEETK